MLFYIKLPITSVDLSQFINTTQERFKYLLYQEFNKNGITKNVIPISSEAVIPGTILDRVGHFSLRFFSLYNPSMASFIITEETKLFIHRLNGHIYTQISKHSQTALRHIRMMESCGTSDFDMSVFSALRNICERLSKLTISKHFVDNCDDRCCTYYIKVPFQICLSLLCTREVVLNGGIATVPCGKWKKFLKELFKHHYSVGQSIISSSSVLQIIYADERWIILFNELEKMYDNIKKKQKGSSHVKIGTLLSDEVDAHGIFFPPCMSNLLSTLRHSHRLSHNPRYYFSLFLKDIGMPIEESVNFWKSEYSKPTSHCSNCQHSWQKEERKFAYSIRHLYGLEGSRIIRNSKSCSKIQNATLTAREEGGCPFVHFDTTNLLKCLSLEILKNEDVKSEILNLTRSNKPSKACSYYMTSILKTHLKKNPVDDLNFESPVECYCSFKESYLSW